MTGSDTRIIQLNINLHLRIHLIIASSMLFGSCCHLPEKEAAHQTHASTASSRIPPCHTNASPRWFVKEAGEKHVSAARAGGLPYLKREPKGTPRAVVILIPGWMGVTCHYKGIIDEMVRHGYTVYATETRGESWDPDLTRRGDMPDWHTWVKDLRAFTRWVRAREPGRRIYYHGHSMGTVIALASVGSAHDSASQPDGLILHSPAFSMLREHDTLKFAALANLLPCKRIDPIKKAHESQNDGVAFKLADDDAFNAMLENSPDRVPGGYTLRFIHEAVQMGVHARKTTRHFAMPMLVIGGGKDATLAFAKETAGTYKSYLCCELSGPNTTLHWESHGFHYMGAGPPQERVFKATIDWLDAQ